MTDWSEWQRCSQVCGAETGKPCRSLSGVVNDGRPDGVVTELDEPHPSRKPRTRRRDEVKP
jgi:hypothetical protein